MTVAGTTLRRVLFMAAIAVMSLALAAPAHASIMTGGVSGGSAVGSGEDPLIWFNFTVAGVNGAILLNTTDNGNGTFSAISATGLINGVPVDLITGGPSPTVSPLGLFIYDNLLYTSYPIVDLYGLMFGVPSGISPTGHGLNTTEINVWFENGSYQYGEGGPGGFVYLTSDVTQVSGVPEPGTLLLLGTGLAGLGAAARRRNRS